MQRKGIYLGTQLDTSAPANKNLPLKTGARFLEHLLNGFLLQFKKKKVESWTKIGISSPVKRTMIILLISWCPNSLGHNWKYGWGYKKMLEFSFLRSVNMWWGSYFHYHCFFKIVTSTITLPLLKKKSQCL